MNLLHIESVRSVPVKDFKQWFIDSTKQVFYRLPKGQEIVPMAFLRSSTEMVSVIPNFKDDAHKSESMRQIRQLARLSNTIAYGFVSEMYLAQYNSKKDDVRKSLEFLSDLDYKVSMLPDRVEGLMVYMEMKTSQNIEYSQAIWQIINEPNRRRLTQYRLLTDPTSFEGKVTNIL